MIPLSSGQQPLLHGVFGGGFLGQATGVDPFSQSQRASAAQQQQAVPMSFAGRGSSCVVEKRVPSRFIDRLRIEIDDWIKLN